MMRIVQLFKDNSSDEPGNSKKGNLNSGGKLWAHLKNVSHLPYDKQKVSEPWFLGKLPWVISLSQQKKHRHDKQFSIFLRCTGDSESVRNGNMYPSWKCRVWVNLRLISKNPGVEPHCEKFENVCFSSGGNIRCPFFFRWTPLVELGYLKDDAMVFEMDIKIINDFPPRISAPTIKGIFNNSGDPKEGGFGLGWSKDSSKCSVCFQSPRHQIVDGYPVCNMCKENRSNMRSQVN